MGFKVADRVKERISTAGTGNLVLVDNAANGFQTFSNALANGDYTYYVLEEYGLWETGYGQFLNGELTRDVVFESYNSGERVDLGGSGTVSITYPSLRSVYKTQDNDYAIAGSGLIFSNDQSSALTTSSNELLWRGTKLTDDAELSYVSGIAAYSSGESVDLDYVSGIAVYASGNLRDVVDDTTPQLGGNLDTNGYNIGNDSVGGLSITTANGNITLDPIGSIRLSPTNALFVSTRIPFVSDNNGTLSASSNLTFNSALSQLDVGGNKVITHGSSDWNYASGAAVFGSGQSIINQTDIAYVSGLVISNDTDISYVSGIALQGSYASGQALINIDQISYVSGISAYNSGQAIINEDGIDYVSGVAAYASGEASFVGPSGTVVFYNNSSAGATSDVNLTAVSADSSINLNVGEIQISGAQSAIRTTANNSSLILAPHGSGGFSVNNSPTCIGPYSVDLQLNASNPGHAVIGGCSIIAGGSSHRIEGGRAGILAGCGHNNDGVDTVVLGGRSACIDVFSNDSSIVGGWGDCISNADRASIIGGSFSSVTCSNNSVIVGGNGNTICNITLSQNSVILGGCNNRNQGVSNIVGGDYVTSSGHASISVGESINDGGCHAVAIFNSGIAAWRDNTTFVSNLSIASGLYDAEKNNGSVGQMLTSVGESTKWIDFLDPAYGGYASGIAEYASGQALINQDGLSYASGQFATDISYVSGAAFYASGIGKNLVYENQSSSLTMDGDEDILFITAASDAVNVYIPAATGNGGKEIKFKKVAGNCLVQLIPNVGETIDGQITHCFTTIYESITLTSNNSHWFIT